MLWFFDIIYEWLCNLRHEVRALIRFQQSFSLSVSVCVFPSSFYLQFPFKSWHWLWHPIGNVEWLRARTRRVIRVMFMAPSQRAMKMKKAAFEVEAAILDDICDEVYRLPDFRFRSDEGTWWHWGEDASEHDAQTYYHCITVSLVHLWITS